MTDASSGFYEGEPAVYVKLDARGASQMLETTRENLGRPMAVVFIEKKRVQARPAVQRRALRHRMHGGGSHQRRDDPRRLWQQLPDHGRDGERGTELALLLRAGSLAAPLYIVEQRTIGPSLGQDNIDRGVRALVIGMLATFVWMVMYYRGVRHGGQRRPALERGAAGRAAVDAAGVAVAARASPASC